MTTDNDDFTEKDLEEIVERGIERSRARRQPTAEDPVDPGSHVTRLQALMERRNGNTSPNG